MPPSASCAAGGYVILQRLYKCWTSRSTVDGKATYKVESTAAGAG